MSQQSVAQSQPSPRQCQPPPPQRWDYLDLLSITIDRIRFADAQHWNTRDNGEYEGFYILHRSQFDRMLARKRYCVFHASHERRGLMFVFRAVRSTRPFTPFPCEMKVSFCAAQMDFDGGHLICRTMYFLSSRKKKAYKFVLGHVDLSKGYVCRLDERNDCSWMEWYNESKNWMNLRKFDYFVDNEEDRRNREEEDRRKKKINDQKNELDYYFKLKNVKL